MGHIAAFRRPIDLFVMVAAEDCRRRLRDELRSLKHLKISLVHSIDQIQELSTTGQLIIADAETLMSLPFHAANRLRDLPILLLSENFHAVQAIPGLTPQIVDFIAPDADADQLNERISFCVRRWTYLRSLRNEQAINGAMLQVLPGALYRIKADGTIVDYAPGIDNTSLAPPEKFLGQHLSSIFDKTSSEIIQQLVTRAITTHTPQRGSYIVTIDDDKHCFEASAARCNKDTAIMVAREVTAQLEAQSRIKTLSYYDELTHLPNKRLFADYLKKTISSARRRNELVAVAVLDLDRFKQVNDTLSHRYGDELIQTVAKRIQKSLRSSDLISHSQSENQIARMGADEFIMYFTDFNSISDLSKIANRIRKLISKPIVIDGKEIIVTPSIGMSVFPHDGTSPDNLLTNAHSAMHHVKAGGGNDFQFYSPEMNARSVLRLDLESKLRRSLKNDEMRLFYQPQVDLKTGKIVGMEALIRWIHPELGMISPLEFIPIAEETGMINKIGDWVVEEACRQFIRWRELGLPQFPISVNVSAHQLKNDTFQNNVETTLCQTGMDPAMLELELTESAIMNRAEDSIKMLNKLKSIGVKLSIDDFGTGYSSLSYLKRFPIDKLKIDREFIKDLTTNADDEAIIGAIIAMAKQLRLHVVAEGVENEAQRDFLRNSGCHDMQGFLFSAPRPADEMTLLLKSYNAA